MEMYITMPLRMNIDTNLRMFQYKILKNVLYLNEKLFEFKIVSSPLCSFCNAKNKTPIHLFYSCNQTKSLWPKLQDLLNSEILLPQKYVTECFLWFSRELKKKKKIEIVNHLHLIFKCYLFKVRDTRKASLEGLKKNIIKICNIEKQICFHHSKKETRF